MRKLIKLSLITILSLPIVTFAQFSFPTFGQTRTLADLARLIIGYLNVGIYLIMGLAIVMFVWNIYRYYIKGGDKVDRAEAAKYLMWSIIGFFIILSFWGLVYILTNTFKLNSMPPNQFFGNFSSSIPGGNVYNTNQNTGAFSVGASNTGGSVGGSNK